MRNSEYLAKRHAQWRVRDSELNALLRQCVGESAVSFDQIVRGADNEVHSALMSSGDACIIRILRCDRDDIAGGVAEEAWCLQACSEAGVPVPEVLGVGTVRDDERTYDAMVLSKLEGAPLSDILPHLSLHDRRHVWLQMGDALSRIHGVKTGGFYRLNPDGSWDFPDWEASCRDSYDSRSKEKPFISQAGFSDDDIDFAFDIISRYKGTLSCPQPVLCHGDFRPGHVFFDPSLTLTGVIDFGMYQGDHPIHDFAEIAMDQDGLMPDGLLDGYGGVIDDRFELRLHFHLVAYLIGYLAYHIQIPNHPETPGLISELRKTLDWLKVHGS